MDQNLEGISSIPTKEREIYPTFEPISQEKLEELKKELSDNTDCDFSLLPIVVTRPGESLFDHQEAKLKLYMKAGSVQAFNELLEKYNISRPNAETFREIAKKEGIILDDTFPGFAYSLGGEVIFYPAIREDKVLEMARKYSHKEGEEINFNTTEEAKSYLESLAEKYFYHEIGHTVYQLILNDAEREIWEKIVLSNKELSQRVIEIQIDKHPNPESIPVANEAFADMFSEVVTKGKEKNRLGNWPREKEMLVEILQRIGIKA